MKKAGINIILWCAAVEGHFSKGSIEDSPPTVWLLAAVISGLTCTSGKGDILKGPANSHLSSPVDRNSSK